MRYSKLEIIDDNFFSGYLSIFSNTPKNWIVFNEEKLTIFFEKEQFVFDWSNIEDMKLHFDEGRQEYNPDFANSLEISPSITFTANGVEIEYALERSRKKFYETCKLLYDKGIKFKEYANGRRMFLGKQPSYKEVQMLKKKYGIEW